MNPLTDKRPRYLFVDALRGIAAVAVMFHHLLHSTVLEPALRHILPAVLQHVATYGAMGVQIFFVISGFVIAHSLARVDPTLPAIGHFILRRQLRLDPPYWASIILILFLAGAERMIPSLTWRPMPTPAGVFANAFYFQNILHITPISEVAWTLCLEIQFYLAFIGVLALGRAAVRGHWRPDRVPTFVWIAVGGFGIASLKWNLRPAIGTTWLGAYWCYFAVGVLICWALSHRMPRPVVDVVLAAMVAATIWRHSPQLIAGCATALAIYGVGLLGRLSTWFSARPLQWLGAISYSLYLVHLPILSVVMRGGYKLTHDNRVAALGWMFLAAALSLIAAYFFHRFIERPSMNLASSLSRNPQPAKVESATIEPPDVEMQAAL